MKFLSLWSNFISFWFLQLSYSSGPLFYLPHPLSPKKNKNPQSFQLCNNLISLRKWLERWKQNSGAGWTACQKKGEYLRFQTPRPTPSTWPKDRPRGKATGDSSFVLWSQVEEEAVPQHCLISATGLCWMIQTLTVLPLLQSYPGKCPYSNKATADSTAFINRSIVNLFISFTCQLS